MVIKTLDSDWIRISIQPKMLDPDPYQMNTDLKHWSFLPPRKEQIFVKIIFYTI
jgi:hypothetical protein